MDQFDLKELHALHEGDVIEVPPMVPGVDPEEAVVGLVTQNTAANLSLRFLYRGVWIGNATLKKETNTWIKVSTESRT
jgi:hypothetical protein